MLSAAKGIVLLLGDLVNKNSPLTEGATERRFLNCNEQPKNLTFDMVSLLRQYVNKKGPLR
jgi:hypothetical protein